MAIGLKVMCSIQSGNVGGGLRESPVKALNGNQLRPVLLTRMGFCCRQVNGLLGYFSGMYDNQAVLVSPGVYAAWPYAKNAVEDMQRQWSLYSGVTITYSNSLSTASPSSFTYTSSLSGTAPQTSYVQTNPGLSASDHDWGQSPSNGNYQCQITSDSSWSQQQYDPVIPPHAIFATWNLSLTGGVDPGAVFAGMKGDFFGASFPTLFSSGFQNIYYKDFPATTSSAQLAPSFINPSEWDGSITLGSPYTGGPYYTGGSSYTAFGGGGTLLSGIALASGWRISASAINGGGNITIFRGQATLDTTVTQPGQPFWIGVYTEATWSPITFYDGTKSSPPPQAAPIKSIKIYRTGILPTDGTIIAYESTGIFQVPFPADAPFPIQDFAGLGVVARFYFVVVGQDPESWASQYGYVFDLTADNANFTTDNTTVTL